jgi:hypothetical protein
MQLRGFYTELSIAAPDAPVGDKSPRHIEDDYKNRSFATGAAIDSPYLIIFENNYNIPYFDTKVNSMYGMILL